MSDADRQNPDDGSLIGMLRRMFASPATEPAPAPTEAKPPETGGSERERRETDALAVDQRIPSKCREKAEAVLKAADALAPRLTARGPGDPLAVEVDRIRSIHLAELLRKYIEIPEEHRAEIFRRTQKSASFHLGASIDVMSERIAEISRTAAQGVLDQFTDGTRFVDTHYGRRDDPFA